MQAIGDSLARGLGMLGALAIIRYRTTLKTPRNMVFTFAALASGIACGVYAFVIALTGTIGFCLIAFALRFSPLSNINLLLGNLSFLQSIDNEPVELEGILSEHCKNYRKVKFQLGKPKKAPIEPIIENQPELISFNYEVSFTSLESCKKLYKRASRIESISQLKISFENVNENV